MSTHLVGASVWEEEMYEHLTSHVENEKDLLAEYQKLAEEANSPAFSYLVQLIIEDEIRHHKLFLELASTLRTDAEFRSEEPLVPRPGGWGPEPRRVAAISQLLIDQEREDKRALRRLERELDDFKDTTLWYLLVKLMEADTNKHIQILKFVRRHARRSS
jgi:rubrerythrin